jgi:small multidrug resistance pump
MHPWVLMAFAIVFEVIGTTCLKLSEGFTKIIPSILIFVFYAISFTLLTYALKKIDLSLAYAIWSGAGTALIALIGIFVFSESVSLIKIISLIFVIIGIVGLKMAGNN